MAARLAEDVPTIVGIDHGFSVPLRYFECTSWRRVTEQRAGSAKSIMSAESRKAVFAALAKLGAPIEGLSAKDFAEPITSFAWVRRQ